MVKERATVAEFRDLQVAASLKRRLPGSVGPALQQFRDLQVAASLKLLIPEVGSIRIL